MTRSTDIHKSGHRSMTSTVASSRLNSVFMALAAIAFPIWGVYANILFLPGSIGWLLILIGLRPVWKGLRWGEYLALVGTLLLLLDLVLLIKGSGILFGGFNGIARWNRDDIWIILSSLITIITAVLLARTLRTRKFSKMHECPSCGYDLQGLPENTKCPECGWDKWDT